MADRTSGQIQWENNYKDELKLISEVRADKLRSAISAGNDGSNSNVTDINTDLTLAGDTSIPSFIPTASIVQSKVVLPVIERKEHQRQLYNYVKQMTATGFAHLDETKFEFSYIQENMFLPSWVSIMYLVHTKASSVLGIQKLHINSGLRTEPEGSGIDGHMAGIACDIKMSGSDRYTFADLCWGLGLRGIGVGQTFVHIDGGPEAHWNYPGVPTYQGPGGGN
jgi:hypothetical protein